MRPGAFACRFSCVAAMAVADLIAFALVAPRTHRIRIVGTDVEGPDPPPDRYLRARGRRRRRHDRDARARDSAGAREPPRTRSGGNRHALRHRRGCFHSDASDLRTAERSLGRPPADAGRSRRLGVGAAGAEPRERFPLGGIRDGADVDGVQHDRHAVARLHGGGRRRLPASSPTASSTASTTWRGPSG